MYVTELDDVVIIASDVVCVCVHICVVMVKQLEYCSADVVDHVVVVVFVIVGVVCVDVIVFVVIIT